MHDDTRSFRAHLGSGEHLFPNTVMGTWNRPWNNHPPIGTWRLCMWSCGARPGVEECTPEVLVDLLRGMVDTGQLNPEDVVRDIVLVNGRWRVRGWQKVQTEQEQGEDR